MSRFDKTEALKFALLAQRSYASATIECKETDTQVLIEPWDDGLAVCNRGTFDTEGWLRDLSIKKVGVGLGVRVHSGFYGDAMSVARAVEAAIPSKATPLVLSGHSKGAGECVNLAKDLFDKGYNVRRVFTLGQPRNGNLAWRASYERALGAVTTRLTHAADVVPWIPSANYWHEAPHVWLPATGGYEEDPSMWRQWWASRGEVLRCYAWRQAAKATGHPEDRWPSLAPLHKDHAIAAYVAAIQAL